MAPVVSLLIGRYRNGACRTAQSRPLVDNLRNTGVMHDTVTRVDWLPWQRRTASKVDPTPDCVPFKGSKQPSRYLSHLDYSSRCLSYTKMFLNERCIFRSDLFDGIKQAGHQRSCALTLARFGPSQSVSLLAIAPELDNVLVLDLAFLEHRLSSANAQLNDDRPRERDLGVSYISVKDQVIESLTVIESGLAQKRRDLLLIGCSKSVVVYDTLNQEHLFSVNTSSKITSMSVVSLAQFDKRLLLGGGVQKLYAYQVDPNGRDLATAALVGLELSSERTISETASCLIHGRFARLELLVVGLDEGRIKVYSIDPLERSIQNCRLTLTESSKINCLCAIETVKGSQANPDASDDRDEAPNLQDQSLLPELGASSDQRANAQPAAQMSYFAFGQENGFVGVYQLLEFSQQVDLPDDYLTEPTKRASYSEQVSLRGERIWRHRSKQVPVSVCLLDIDGDGADELIIGYRNGRLEVRAPFSGQLLASTRCFRSNTKLVGLLKWSLDLPVQAVSLQDKPLLNIEEESQLETTSDLCRREILLACSSTSALVAFKPKWRAPRKPLTNYLADTVVMSQTDEVRLGDVDQSSPARVPGLDELASGWDNEAEDSARALPDNDEENHLQSWPVSCESRQNSELLKEIGKKMLELTNLREKVSSAQRELFRQLKSANQTVLEFLTIDGGLVSQAGPIQTAHFWNFDGTNLLLTVLVESMAGEPVSIEMVEFVESKPRLLHDGHLVLDSSAATNRSHSSISIELVLSSPSLEMLHRKRSRHDRFRDETSDLLVVIFMPDCATQQNCPIRSVLKQTLVVPKFAMFVPAALTGWAAPTGDTESQMKKRLMIKKTFVLPERATSAQILNWIGANFLSLQASGRTPTTRHKSATPGASESEQFLWIGQARQQLDVEAALNVCQPNAPESSAARSREDQYQLMVEGGFNFSLVDLRTLHEPATAKRIGLEFEPEACRLTLASNESDCLVELVQSLAVDRLKLDCRDHNAGSDGMETLNDELNSIDDNSRQLEESERRIQTEIYESAELIKSLMQQLSVANELQMFVVSKELLAEAAMLLDGTQNSAQAFYLNSRSRTDLMRRANCLREQMAFLSGGDCGLGAYDMRPGFSE